MAPPQTSLLLESSADVTVVDASASLDRGAEIVRSSRHSCAVVLDRERKLFGLLGFPESAEGFLPRYDSILERPEMLAAMLGAVLEERGGNIR